MEINNISPIQENKDLSTLFKKRLTRKQERGGVIFYVLK